MPQLNQSYISLCLKNNYLGMSKVFMRREERNFLFVCVEVLRPSQQLRSCRAGQLPINTVPGQA